MEITNKRIADIIPYDANAKKHDKRQINNVAESIKQYGFVQPIVIDRDGVIVIGHCRAMAAKKLGMEEVPCVCVDDLTPEQVNALRLVDNKSNESDWDFDLLSVELPGLDLSAFDFDFSFPELDESEIEEMTKEQREQEFRERMERGELSDDDEDYQAFLEKFEAKKTTDDCYTPDNIYDAVRDWATEKYEIGNAAIVRPFYPGGDYERFDYQDGCVVLDNPPFSILSRICEFYIDRGIAFFLFAPSLTCFSGRSVVMRMNHIICDADITYENGAVVRTAFVTSFGGKIAQTAPTLRKAIERAMQTVKDGMRKELPKYTYPDYVLTAAMMQKYAHYGVDFAVQKEDCTFIAKMDAQSEHGKAIFGGGLLLSEKAAAEKAAAHIWELSERERHIVAKLGE